jgi:hypothetical protein
MLRNPSIAAIVNLNNEFFYTHFFDESNTDSDDDADLMVAVATVLNESNEAYMPQWRGSVKGRAANLNRNWENGHHQRPPTIPYVWEACRWQCPISEF